MAEPLRYYSTSEAKTHVNQIQTLASSLGIPIWTILQLILEYGPKAAPILIDVLNAFKGGFSWDKLTTLIKADAPMVIAIVTAIASALGIQVPPMPTGLGG